MPREDAGADSLKPSLEGWKQTVDAIARNPWGALKPSLEGWKRIPLLAPAAGVDPLETFLRGMETAFIVPQTSSSSLPLKPSLEGWKPSMRYVLLLGSSCLETFLRGMETWRRQLWKIGETVLETFLRGMETPAR